MRVQAAGGAVIGIDIRDSRQRDAESPARAEDPRWLAPLLALLALLAMSAFLGVGLLLGVAMRALWREPGPLVALLITGAVLAVLTAAGVLALILRRCRLRGRQSPCE